MTQTLGYARVITGDQDVAGQTMRLEEAGASKVFNDVMSGKTMDRPGLTDLLAYARADDTLAVVRLDRLGRSLAELLTTVTMLRERQIALISLEEKIDTSSAAGELIFDVFGAIALAIAILKTLQCAVVIVVVERIVADNVTGAIELLHDERHGFEPFGRLKPLRIQHEAIASNCKRHDRRQTEKSCDFRDRREPRIPSNDGPCIHAAPMIGFDHFGIEALDKIVEKSVTAEP